MKAWTSVRLSFYYVATGRAERKGMAWPGAGTRGSWAAEERFGPETKKAVRDRPRGGDRSRPAGGAQRNGRRGWHRTHPCSQVGPQVLGAGRPPARRRPRSRALRWGWGGGGGRGWGEVRGGASGMPVSPGPSTPGVASWRGRPPTPAWRTGMAARCAVGHSPAPFQPSPPPQPRAPAPQFQPACPLWAGRCLWSVIGTPQNGRFGLGGPVQWEEAPGCRWSLWPEVAQPCEEHLAGSERGERRRPAVVRVGLGRDGERR